MNIKIVLKINLKNNIMDIKDFILSGGSLSYSYKFKPTDWVGTATIQFFQGYFEQPKITIKIDVCKEWSIEQIDEAIKYFTDTVFNKKNLWWGVEKIISEFHTKGEYIDLEDEDDYDKVMTIREERIKNNTL